MDRSEPVQWRGLVAAVVGMVAYLSRSAAHPTSITPVMSSPGNT